MKLQLSLQFRVQNIGLKQEVKRNFEEKGDDHMKNVWSTLELLNIKEVPGQGSTSPTKGYASLGKHFEA